MKRKGVGVQTVVVMGIMLVMAAVIVPSLGGLQDQLKQTGQQGNQNLGDAADEANDALGDGNGDGNGNGNGDGSGDTSRPTSDVIDTTWNKVDGHYGAPSTFSLVSGGTFLGESKPAAPYIGEYVGPDPAGTSGDMDGKTLVKDGDSWVEVSSYFCGSNTLSSEPYSCGQTGGDNLVLNADTPFTIESTDSGKAAFVISRGWVKIKSGEYAGEVETTPTNRTKVTGVPQEWMQGSTVCGNRCVVAQDACEAMGGDFCDSASDSAAFADQKVEGSFCQSWADAPPSYYAACAISGTGFTTDVSGLINGCNEVSDTPQVDACPSNDAGFKTFVWKNLTTADSQPSWTLPSGSAFADGSAWMQYCKYNANFYPTDGSVNSAVTMRCMNYIGKSCVTGADGGEASSFKPAMCKQAMQSLCPALNLAAVESDSAANGWACGTG
ncbi:MAG: hypothetical protein SV186_01245 [Candidatus Nanohaloarchaea archaeon]|nr:hypothetical protein [Candidatus Nanohaloarchaea archaeon]